MIRIHRIFGRFPKYASASRARNFFHAETVLNQQRHENNLMKNMKKIIPTFFKVAAIGLVSAGIFFLVATDEQAHDQALANSMNFLGKKLLAMVPHEEGKHVEEQYRALEAEALEGRVDPRELQNFAVTVLNLEAEGKKLQAEKIASMIAEARKRRAKQIDKERLHRLATQLREYEQFQFRFHELAPFAPPPSHPDSTAPRPPHYRLSPQFTVQIDTFHFAFGHVSPAPVISIGHVPPVPVLPFGDSAKIKIVLPPIEVQEKLKAIEELSRELRDLRIEFGKIQVEINTDSMLVDEERVRPHLYNK
jgi:hypothetical protein